MTSNQIRWLEAQEAARANKAKELETQRSNLIKEKETERSNLAKESETNRANLEAERLNREKWDYEKYGKDGVGGTIRTIKAALNDTSKVGSALSSGISEIKKSQDPTNQKTIGEVVQGNTSSNNVKVGGIDLKGVQSAIKSSKSEFNLNNLNKDNVGKLTSDQLHSLKVQAAKLNEWDKSKIVEDELARRASERKIHKERGLTK